MAVTERDIELLESYLDDELAGRELESLRQRLSAEPALASAMDDLRAQREARQQFFAACAPDEASVQRLIRSVGQQVTRELVEAPRNSSGLRWAGSVAACLLVGFTLGRGWRTSGPAVMPEVANLQTSSMHQVPQDIPRTPVRFDGPIVAQPPLPTDAVVAENRPNRDFSLRETVPADVVSAHDPFPGSRIFIVNRNNQVERQFNSHEQYMKFVNDKLSSSTTQPTGAPFAH